MAERRVDLARARKAAGFTQESLAEALAVDRTTVVRWEGGSGEPLPFLRTKLAKLLKLGLADLEELLSPFDDVAPITATSWLVPAIVEDDELAALDLAR